MADAILVQTGLTGWTVRQLETVMDRVSWGSEGEVNATRLSFSGGQEKVPEAEGRGGQQGGGVRTWKHND